MSIRQITVYAAQCDRCGRRTLTDGYPVSPVVYPTEEAADTDLVSLGWYTDDPLDDIAVCNACRAAIDAGEAP